MLSINYIIKFLSDKQEKINQNSYQKIKHFELNKDIVINNENINNLPDSFKILFNNNFTDFYYNKNINKNKSLIFTFINSLIIIGDETFNLNNECEREKTVKELIKKMDNDLFEKDLYNKFNYNKNRRFNKADIQYVLKNAFQFKSCDKINLLKEYISDFLGINIYIIYKNNDTFDNNKCEFYLSKNFNGQINKYLPNFILLYENEIYKPLLINNDNSSILIYSKYNEIIDNIWTYFNIKEELLDNEKEKDNEKSNENIKTMKYVYNDIKNLKIDEIKNICIENDISLLKKSDKTSKMINKLKVELIADLLNL